jgi:hypothetical protein
MIRRLRDPFGGRASREAADAAVGRGMADVLAALDSVVDDDAALGRIYAALGTRMPGEASGRPAGTTAGQGSELGSAITTRRARGTVRSRRRLVLRSAGVVAAALAAGAVALLVVVVPGARPVGTETPAVSAAYVVKQVKSALSAAEPGEVAHMTFTTRGAATSGGGTTAEEWSFGRRWRTVTYSAAGRPVYDEGVSASSVFTVVSYKTRAWARRAGAGQVAPLLRLLPLLPSGLGGGPGLRSGSLVTVTGFLHNAVSHGSLAMAGRQRVDGIEAIKLTSPPGSLLAETVWVSPRTYLPVRVVTRPVPGQPGSGQTADISWLPPTGHNLARLTVPVPGGFRELPLAEVAGPGPGLIPPGSPP